LEARAQCTGEAEYLLDIPTVHGELYAAYVTAKVAPATFNPDTDIDTTAALVRYF
jgi:hypothetical protein